jgi:acylphosphatase
MTSDRSETPPTQDGGPGADAGRSENSGRSDDVARDEDAPRSADAPGIEDAAGPVRLEAVVEGKVQGVGFRMFVVDRARDLGLVGWVANEPGGQVRCVAEGPRRSLEALLDDLREGPRGARVERVADMWAIATGEFGRFGVRSGWHSGD